MFHSCCSVSQTLLESGLFLTEYVEAVCKQTITVSGADKTQSTTCTFWDMFWQHLSLLMMRFPHCLYVIVTLQGSTALVPQWQFVSRCEQSFEGCFCTPAITVSFGWKTSTFTVFHSLLKLSHLSCWCCIWKQTTHTFSYKGWWWKVKQGEKFGLIYRKVSKSCLHFWFQWKKNESCFFFSLTCLWGNQKAEGLRLCVLVTVKRVWRKNSCNGEVQYLHMYM